MHPSPSDVDPWSEVDAVLEQLIPGIDEERMVVLMSTRHALSHNMMHLFHQIIKNDYQVSKP